MLSALVIYFAPERHEIVLVRVGLITDSAQPEVFLLRNRAREEASGARGTL